MRFFVALALASCLSVCNAHAQDSVSVFKNIRPFKNYLTSYITDAAGMAVAPVTWDQKDVLIATGVFAGTVILWKYDEQIYENISLRDESAQDILSGFDHFGDGIFSLPLLAGIFTVGKISKTPYDCEVAMLGLKTFVLNAAATRVVKYTFQRHRPSDDIPPDALAFEGPLHGVTGYNSFVSGHSSSAFALATILSKAYGKKKKWVPWVVWPVASLVAFSRVYDGSHWATDAFAGAAFGYSTGLFMYHFNLKNK